ncbi:hypothetical protein CFE70_005479 [Pyrenophora teres f. teres 0-1]
MAGRAVWSSQQPAAMSVKAAVPVFYTPYRASPNLPSAYDTYRRHASLLSDSCDMASRSCLMQPGMALIVPEALSSADEAKSHWRRLHEGNASSCERVRPSSSTRCVVGLGVEHCIMSPSPSPALHSSHVLQCAQLRIHASSFAHSSVSRSSSVQQPSGSVQSGTLVPGAPPSILYAHPSNAKTPAKHGFRRHIPFTTIVL